jgi:hypothetical protein
MPEKSRIPVSRRKHTYYGEDIAESLVEYLNTNPGKSDAVERLYSAHEELLSSGPKHTYAVVLKIRKILRLARVRPFFELRLMQRSEQSERYTTNAIAMGHVQEGFRGRIPKMVVDLDHWVVEWEPSGPKRSRRQARAFSAFIDLGKLGLLRHVKRCMCAGCPNRFFARFLRQRFCSETCERKFHRSSPEWKHNRRTYMKRWRNR